MRSTIIIEHKGGGYRATVQGKFGGGYSNASAGDTAEKAAALAAREMIRYGQTNPEGGSLIAPAEVLALVPAYLHEIDGGVSRGGHSSALWYNGTIHNQDGERVGVDE